MAHRGPREFGRGARNPTLQGGPGPGQGRRRGWDQVGVVGDGMWEEGQPCRIHNLHGVYNLVCSSAWKRSLTIAPSSSFFASQRPQGNVMHFPRDGASTSTQSTNQPGALPGEMETQISPRSPMQRVYCGQLRGLQTFFPTPRLTSTAAPRTGHCCR